MKNILEKIITFKRIEVAENKLLYPAKLLEKSISFNAPVVSMKKYILRKDKSGIIAEIKRKSPSKGVINKYVSIEQTSIGYMQAGACALSILTDKNYFDGKNDDLVIARKFNYCPILRKDFIIDEYQIVESRSIGADTILLISAVLSANEIFRLAKFAKSLQLEVILEVHNKQELQSMNEFIDIVGVNNRDLSTFITNINNSIELLTIIPNGVVKISESGIGTPLIAANLKKAGFDGLLIGEQFMKHSRPEVECANFIKQFKSIVYAN